MQKCVQIYCQKKKICSNILLSSIDKKDFNREEGARDGEKNWTFVQTKWKWIS